MMSSLKAGVITAEVVTRFLLVAMLISALPFVKTLSPLTLTNRSVLRGFVVGTLCFSARLEASRVAADPVSGKD